MAMRRKTIDQDVDQEIRFHVDERAAELIADGMDADRARAEARRVFGDERRIRSECRDITRK
ncbi:MAG: permease prefix domain 1-containing protein, partial [Acidobacteriota bacterium]